MAHFKTIYGRIRRSEGFSAWDKGVRLYACELCEQIMEDINNGWIDEKDLHAPHLLEKALLNGAQDWHEYSWGGCSLIYDSDIALRLCTASQLMRTQNGTRKPNKNEEWLDVQARALAQAASIIIEEMEKWNYEKWDY